MTLGMRIKAVRKHFKFTQDEVALKLSVTKQTLSRYENDERKPDADFIIEFVRKYKLDANWFIYGTGEMLLGEAQDAVGGSTINLEINRIFDDIPIDAELLTTLSCFKIPLLRYLLVAEAHKLKKQYREEIENYLNQEQGTGRAINND